MPEPWSWREKEPRNAGLGLLYEPGNLGDFLKGGAAAAAARRLAAGGRPLCYADPFAGAPDYPLVDSARSRLPLIAGSFLAQMVEPWVATSRWPGTASIVATAARAAGGAVEVHVFDADERRRAALAATPGFRLLPIDDGWVFFPPRDPFDLVLVDPYDLDAVWRERLDTVLETARRSSVLAYVYNRAPRGPSELKEYGAFRKALAAGRVGGGLLIARVPADAFFPRAFHEVIWLPGPALAPEADRGVRAEVAAFARALSRAVAEPSIVEEA